MSKRTAFAEFQAQRKLYVSTKDPNQEETHGFRDLVPLRKMCSY